MAKESLWSETWPLIKALALVGMTQAYVGEITVSQGPSMLPTLQQTGDILFVDKLSPRWRPIQRDEIVVAASPHKLGEAVCKRVLALEGDVVTVGGSSMRVRIPPGHVWLEGDNKSNSTDSRKYGPVPLALVKGRVIGRMWPPQDACWFGPSSPEPSQAER